MNFLKSFFSKVVGFFRSGKAEAAFNQVAALVPYALPVVEAIAKYTPTKTDDQIVAAYQRYGVPLLADLQKTPANQRGYLLLDLAAQVLAEKFPGVATNLLHSAVQVCVTAIKAQ